MNKMMKKILSVVLGLAMLFYLLPLETFASNKTIMVDGYTINILENSASTVKVGLVDNGKEYIMTHDLFTNEFTLKETTYESNIFRRLFLNTEEETNDYDVYVQTLTEDKIIADVAGVDTDENYKIERASDEILAQAPLVLGVPAAAAALLEALLAILAAVVIAGVTWYVASKVISTLKREQPGVKYYTAMLYRDNVYLGTALKTKSQAVLRLAAGGSVFAIASGYAYDACKSASPIRKVSTRQKHGTGNNNYYHYHPMITVKKQSSAHCWYI